MNFKDIGKGLKKLGKSKIAKEIVEEVTDESLESITNGLLEKNKELLNSVGNQWKKEAIDTTGALSHLPEINPMPKGALRNKGKSVLSKSPLRVIERTGKYRSGYDVVGMSADFDIEGVIKSKNARNYLIGSLDVGPFKTRYLLGGKAKKTPENKLLGDRVSFNVNAQNYIDNGVDAPYWVRKRAGRTNVKAKKEIPVNNSTQQEQQLLLDAPKQKEPRKPRRKYKSDLGTNTEPIELSGPTKNRRLGNRAVKKPTQQEQQLLLEAPKQKSPRKPRREYKSDLGVNTEPIELSGPIQSSPAVNKRLDNIEKVEETYKAKGPGYNNVKGKLTNIIYDPTSEVSFPIYYEKVDKDNKKLLTSNTVKKDVNHSRRKDVKSINYTNEIDYTKSNSLGEHPIKSNSFFEYNNGNNFQTQVKGWTDAEGNKHDYFAIDNDTLQYAKENASFTSELTNDMGVFNGYFDDEGSLMYATLNGDVDVTQMITDTAYSKNGNFKEKSIMSELQKNKAETNNINYKPSNINSTTNSTASQSKPEPKNNKVDVSIDDFKPADELDLTDDNENNVSHLFEESDTIKDSQLDKLEELRENGILSQEEYEKAIDNVINDSNMNIETDSPIMSEPAPEPEPEVKNQPKKRQSRRQQRKEENLKNNHQQTSTQEQQLNNRKQIDVTDTIKNESDNIEQETQKNQQQIFNEYAEQNFKPLEVSDGDLSAFKTGDGYDVTLRNARAENITFNDTNYDVLYDENNNRVFRNTQTGDFVQDQELSKSLNSIGENERNKYLTNLSDDNWDLIAGNEEKGITANPEKFGFNRGATEGVEGYDAHLMNEMDANNFRKAAAEAKSKDTQKAFGEEKDKKIKKQLEDKRNKLDIEALKAQKIANTKKIQLEGRELKKEAGKKFNEALGLDKFEKGSAEYYKALNAAKGTAAYEGAVKDLKKQMSNISKSKEFAIKNSNKTLDSQIKGLTGKGMNLTKAITIGNAAIAAVDKYKQSKAEGKSTGSALIRAGGAAVAGEVLGIPGTIALTVAQTAPKAIIAGADALYKEYRRMNSASNFVPLGGVNFQDSQELATMRQSGMELAKMSQYNLEQSLMGAEAKHLHR